MHKWRIWVDIRVKVGKWPAAKTGLLFENSSQSPVEAWVVSFMFCLSDLVKRHLSYVSWSKDISIRHFQIGDILSGSISLGCFTLPTSCETHTCFSLDLPVSSLLWARDWADSTWTSVLPCCPSYVRSSYLLLTSIPTAEWEIT